MAGQYTIQDLQDNLNYLEETKGLIKQALIDKEVNVSDTDSFRSYADKIRNIVNYDEDLVATINEQEALIESQSNTIIELENTLTEKEGNYTYFNIYCQEADPPSFVGIWFNKEIPYSEIVVIDDTESNILAGTYEPNAIILKDGHSYKTQLYGPIPGKVVGNIGTCFDNAYIADDKGKIITDIKVYYGDGDENWIEM